MDNLRIYEILLALETNRTGNLLVDEMVSQDEADYLSDYACVDLVKHYDNNYVITMTDIGRKKFYELNELITTSVDKYPNLPEGYAIERNTNTVNYELSDSMFRTIAMSANKLILIHKAWKHYYFKTTQRCINYHSIISRIEGWISDWQKIYDKKITTDIEASKEAEKYLKKYKNGLANEQRGLAELDKTIEYIKSYCKEYNIYLE